MKSNDCLYKSPIRWIEVLLWLVFELLFIAMAKYGVYLHEIGKLRGHNKTMLIITAIVAAVCPMLSGLHYDVHNQYMVVKMFGIPLRKAYWKGFCSGVMVHGKKYTGTGWETMVLLTLKTCRKNWKPHKSDLQYFHSKHTADTFLIPIRKGTEEEALQAFRKTCPEFTVFDPEKK